MNKKEKLLKVLIIELEDVIEDLNALVESYTNRNKTGEITDYVYKENTSLLTNEQSCIREYLGVFGSIWEYYGIRIYQPIQMSKRQ